MKLTKEQQAILRSKGNIKINAVAGSGKTTTIIEYAKSRPAKSKILYLAFNRSVRLEAINKFRKEGLTNVDVETAHSLAFKHVVKGFHYIVRPQGYKTHEIVDILGIRGNGEKHTEFIFANHINKFVTYFCNSKAKKVQELDYLQTISDTKARDFVEAFYKYIEKKMRLFLSKMNEGEIEITHDFYLKKFQLSQPRLKYDYILFDEGQDASAAMLDTFFNQKSTKVIVGDTHQQIYSWRYAVNSLEQADFKTYNLTTSFRFNPEVAGLAMEVLKWKEHLEMPVNIPIRGAGKHQKQRSRAVLARTNLGLLLKAIEYLTKRNIERIYFEGNIHSYTYADEGTSLYDVLNLSNGKRRLIKDKLIREMRDINDLEDYIEKTEDVQLAMMLYIVKEYGNDIPSIIKTLKELHVDNDEKDKAEIIFTTVHRCKGMEYDTIQLVDDFITEEKLEKIIREVKKEYIDYAKLNEEINLLYVAVTRTKNTIHIPETLLPADYSPSKKIRVIKAPAEKEKEEKVAPAYFEPELNPPPENARNKSYSVEAMRETYTSAYKHWTEEQDDELTVKFCEGAKVKELAKHFGRTTGAIRARIKKLELKEKYVF